MMLPEPSVREEATGVAGNEVVGGKYEGDSFLVGEFDRERDGDRPRGTLASEVGEGFRRASAEPSLGEEEETLTTGEGPVVDEPNASVAGRRIGGDLDPSLPLEPAVHPRLKPLLLDLEFIPSLSFSSAREAIVDADGVAASAPTPALALSAGDLDCFSVALDDLPR